MNAVEVIHKIPPTDLLGLYLGSMSFGGESSPCAASQVTAALYHSHLRTAMLWESNMIMDGFYSYVY